MSPLYCLALAANMGVPGALDELHEHIRKVLDWDTFPELKPMKKDPDLGVTICDDE